MADEREITAPLEVEELQAGWERKGEERPRQFAVLQMGAKTDLGRVRENNEDKFDCLEPDEPAVLARKGRFYAVADGMGGHSAGQIASELALTTAIRTYYADTDTDIEASLHRAMEAANAYLVDIARMIPGRQGMGTTFTGAVVRDGDLYVVQVGDSRLYLIRDGAIRQITEDHSWVAEQVRRGIMSLEEAESSPYRNMITRSLGAADTVEPDILAVELRPGDRFLLCSDGLSGVLADRELLEIAGAGSPSVAAWNLIDRANLRGGKDNITALVLSVEEIVLYDEVAGERRVMMDFGSSDVAGTGAVDARSARTPVSTAAGTLVSAPACSEELPASDGRAGSARRGLMRALFGKTGRGA
jgi:protein phosphatase